MSAAKRLMSGSGLGLAIIKNIADHHKATIHLSDNASCNGRAVTVIFPHTSPPLPTTA
jgi:nitrogen fixation/metabolism regulation signal transduction histidine kinase